MSRGDPKLYQRRKKHIEDMRDPRPTFATKTMRSHRRPHTTLPELRVVERPEERLATKPIEETPAYERDEALE